MTKRVIWCRPETNLAAAAALLWENDIGVLLVLDDARKLCGILTDRHMCIAVGTRNRRPSELKAGDVMENRVLTCKATDHIRAAVHLMRQANVRRLPVVSDHGAVEGIVSIDDILNERPTRLRQCRCHILPRNASLPANHHSPH